MSPGRPEPQRTCLGCRQRLGKFDLLRMVRGMDGRVRVDPTGKAAGRGAYVHRSTRCLALATRGGGIARALRTPLDVSEAARLMDELKSSLGARE